MVFFVKLKSIAPDLNYILLFLSNVICQSDANERLHKILLQETLFTGFSSMISFRSSSWKLRHHCERSLLIARVSNSCFTVTV